MAKVHLKDVRIAFVQNLFEAGQVQGQGDAKYSSSFIFGRTHPQLAEIQKAIVDAATEKWGAKATEMLTQLKAGDKLCVHDGDSKASYEGYPGNLFINASNKVRPLVVDGNRNPLTASDGKPYSGCYVNVLLDVWAQDNKFGKRVNASLLGVQFLRDGPRLAGGASASADDFDAIPQEAAAAAAATGGGAASLF
jgi:hypothetical protein